MLTDEDLLTVRTEARLIARNRIPRQVEAFLKEERKRSWLRVWVFAGVNFIAIVGLVASLWAVAAAEVRRTAEDVTKKTAETTIVQTTVKAVADSATDSIKQLSDLKVQIDNALLAAENAKSAAKLATEESNNAVVDANALRKQAKEKIEQFQTAARDAGDQQVVNTFSRLADLTKELKGKTLDDLQLALRIDAEKVASKQIAKMLPIGAILPWHRDLDGVPGELPIGWVPCNGPLTQDPESEVDMQRIPNLNGEHRFLRGSTNSGILESYATAIPIAPFVIGTAGEHNHAIDRRGPTGAVTATVEGGGSSGDQGAIGTRTAGAHTHPLAGGDSETRPINMSVVWIIRIK